MQSYAVILILLSSGAVSGGLETVLKKAEFIDDIYQKLPHVCMFLISSEAQHQGFETTVLMQTIRKYIIYQYVPVMKNILKSGTKESCVAQLSMYVILRGNEETRSYISEVRIRLSDSYSSKAIWLLFLDNKTSLEQFFTDINIPFDCQFLVAQPQGDHVVVLTEVYRVSPTLPLQTYRFGNWSAGGGLTWPSQGLYRRRNNLEGHIIRAARLSVVLYREQLYVDELWSTITDSLHVTNVFHGANSMGSENENRTWTGMTALVISGIADIGVGTFVVTKKRSEVVAHSDTIGSGSNNVFIRLPNNSALIWNRYAAPFSRSLWLAVATAVCILTVCLALINCVYERNQGFTVSTILFYVHACFCQQGQPHNVSNTSGRIVIFTLHVTSLVLLAAYSAFLISSLAVQSQSLPFRDLQGLLDDGSYKLGVLANSSHLNIFDRATGGIESVVYKKLIAPFKNEMPKSFVDGLRRVCAEEKYAFLSSKILATYFSWQESCQLVPLAEPSFLYSSAFIISKNSSYKGPINWRLAQLRERGIQARIRQQYVPLKESHTPPSVIDVNVLKVAPIFAVLVAGYVIAIAILVVERCVHGDIFKYQTRKSIGRRPIIDFYWLEHN